jgi:hypothetical protein
MWRKVLVAFCIVLLLVSATIGVLNYRHLRILEEKNLSLEYSLAQAGEAISADTIEPNVGTIQFLRRGYTIQLESVKYEANGLTLKGYVGNPNWLWIYNLTLDFYASRHQSFEDFKKDPFRGGFVAAAGGGWLPALNSQEIGTAQTTPIASLTPGGKQQFEVTIPNVRQETDYQRKPILSLRFSGERYSYSP